MDIVTENKTEFRLRQWTKIIQECQASNLTVKAWCSQHNIGIKSYYYWLRKIRLTYCQATRNQTPAAKQEIVPLQFHPQPCSSINHPAVTIHLGTASIDIAENLASNDRSRLTISAKRMLGDITRAKDIYIVCGYTDMRKSIDGLAAIVKESFGMDPFAASLFLFCGKKRGRMKALLWEGDGFVLLYKRLENGNFKWPRTKEQVRYITMKEFRWLMEGLEIDQPKAIRNIKPGDFC